MATAIEQAPRPRRAGVNRFEIERRVRRGEVARLVEREIIPRLLASCASPAQARGVEGGAITTGQVERIAALACAAEPYLMYDEIDGLADGGCAPETLFVELFAPAARLLGTWWEEDERDFTEVTIGLWRLQEAVRMIAARVPPRAWPGDGARRVLFAAMPGDQHGFGAILIGETFTRAGWRVDLGIGEDARALITRVADGSYDLVGITVSLDRDLAVLPSLIQSMRAVSRHPSVRIMVGGRIFVAEPALAMQVGADGTAPDATSALDVAEDLVERAAGAFASFA